MKENQRDTYIRAVPIWCGFFVGGQKKQKKIGYYVILRNVGKYKEYTFAISIRLDKMGSLLV